MNAILFFVLLLVSKGLAQSSEEMMYCESFATSNCSGTSIQMNEMTNQVCETNSNFTFGNCTGSYKAKISTCNGSYWSFIFYSDEKCSMVSCTISSAGCYSISNSESVLCTSCAYVTGSDYYSSLPPCSDEGCCCQCYCGPSSSYQGEFGISSCSECADYCGSTYRECSSNINAKCHCSSSSSFVPIPWTLGMFCFYVLWLSKWSWFRKEKAIYFDYTSTLFVLVKKTWKPNIPYISVAKL